MAFNYTHWASIIGNTSTSTTAKGIFGLRNNLTPPVTGPTVIGQSFGGGYYVGQISTTANGVATHYLIISGRTAGQSGTLAWLVQSGWSPDYLSTIDGPTNTTNLYNWGYWGINNNDPGGWLNTYKASTGINDWYYPASLEMDVIYYNIKPNTNSNSTSVGINAYAVPQRSSNYTTTVPAQNIVTSEAQLSSNTYYWTSTTISGDASTETALDSNTGGRLNVGVTNTGFAVCRPIRRIAV